MAAHSDPGHNRISEVPPLAQADAVKQPTADRNDQNTGSGPLGAMADCASAAVTMALLTAMSFAVDGELHLSHLLLLAVPVLASLAIRLHDRTAGRIAGVPSASSEREFRLDLLRLFAITGVICIHAVDAMFPSVTTGAAPDPAMAAILPGTGTLDLYAALRTCCYGFNIVYIMISGALLMRWKDEPLKDFYLKRVSKVLLPLLIYYFFYHWQNGMLFPLSAARIGSIFRGFFTADIELCPFYWLIYIIISLYLIYPFMRYMMKDLPYPALTVLAAGIVLFSGTVAYTGFVFAPVIGFWLGYAILGYWITRPESRRFDRFLLLFGIVQAVVIFRLIRQSTVNGTGHNGYMGLITPYTPIMVFLCLGYFAFVYLLPKRLIPGGKLIRFFSKYSFSAILVHWWVLYFILGRFYTQAASAGAQTGIFRSLFLSGGIFHTIYDALLIHTGTHSALIWLVAADLILSAAVGALFEEYVLKAPLRIWDLLVVRRPFLRKP